MKKQSLKEHEKFEFEARKNTISAENHSSMRKNDFFRYWTRKDFIEVS